MRGITLGSKEIAIANVVAFHGDKSFRMDDLLVLSIQLSESVLSKTGVYRAETD